MISVSSYPITQHCYDKNTVVITILIKYNIMNDNNVGTYKYNCNNNMKFNRHLNENQVITIKMMDCFVNNS